MFLYQFVFSWSFKFSIIPTGISQHRTAAAATSPFNPPRLRGRRGWRACPQPRSGWPLVETEGGRAPRPTNWGGASEVPVGYRRWRRAKSPSSRSHHTATGGTGEPPQEPRSICSAPPLPLPTPSLPHIFHFPGFFGTHSTVRTAAGPPFSGRPNLPAEPAPSQATSAAAAFPPVLRGAYLSTPATRSRTRTTRNDPH